MRAAISARHLALGAAVTAVLSLAVASPASADHLEGIEFYEEGTAARVFAVAPTPAIVVACDTGTSMGDLGILRIENHYYWEEPGDEFASALFFGRATDEGLCGDWDGDGKDNAILRRGNTVYFGPWLDKRLGQPPGPSGAGSEAVVETQAFGRVTDDVLVGDWDGDGTDTLAVRRGQQFYFSNVPAGQGEARAQWVVPFGWATEHPTAGDWDGDGVDTLGVMRGNVWHLTNASGTEHRATHETIAYGRSGDLPVPGDWDDDGFTELGVTRLIRLHL